MGHLSNFLLDILSVLEVHGVARLRSPIAYFIDYICIGPQIDVDGMLENRKRSLAGFRMAGKYLAIIQPFSALLANPKFCSEHSMHAYMRTCCVNGNHASAWRTSRWSSGRALHC